MVVEVVVEVVVKVEVEVGLWFWLCRVGLGSWGAGSEVLSER